MKLNDIIILESVTFVPAYFDKERNYYTSPMSKKTTPCTYCDGTGVDPDEDHPCYYCEGNKTETTNTYDAPDMDVSNANASSILQMIGVEVDDSGVIPNNQLPEIRRKLITLKNSEEGQQSYTRDGSESQGEKRRTVTKNADGTTSITASSGPTMIDYGRTLSQVQRYIDKLLVIIDYAQKKGWNVMWS